MKLSKTRLALALAMTAPASFAQSALTVYGNIDLGIDHVHKQQGNVQGTVFGSAATGPVPNAVAAPASSLTRLSPSLSQQSYLGFKGSEDLGGGLAAKVVLESSLQADNGQVANDGRLFGRLAYVGLTTPLGEVRLGRQASPMLMAYYLNSVEQIGSTDLMGAGIVVNNLQTYQDNVLSYIASRDGWIGSLSYSPNAGVASAISGARATATSSVPAATTASGQILGGLGAGAESSSRRGQTYGALLAWRGSALTATLALHYNRFEVPVGLPTAAGGFLPLYQLRHYGGAMAGVKYTVPGAGTVLAANLHEGRFFTAGGADPRVVTVALGVKQPVGAFGVGVEFLRQRFTNFTQGSSNGIMLALDYSLSRRTVLYSRAGVVSDDRGRIVRGELTPLPLAGGPSTVLIPFGSTEIPTFSGAGANMDTHTSIVSLGIRHGF